MGSRANFLKHEKMVINMSKQLAEIRDVGPDLAKLWLSSSPGNRDLRKWWVEQLAAQMKAGNWQISPQGIAFDEVGALLDGHHRLEAVVLSGVTVKMLVMTGFPRSSYLVLDQGVKRTISDVTEIPSKESEAIILAAKIMLSSGRVTPNVCLQIYKTSLGQALHDLLEYAPSTRKTFSSAPCKLAAAMCHIQPGKGNLVFESYRRLTTLALDEMTAIERSFVKQSVSGTVSSGGAGRRDLLARAFRVFSGDSSATKLTISDSYNDFVYKFIKGELNKMVGNSVS